MTTIYKITLTVEEVLDPESEEVCLGSVFYSEDCEEGAPEQIEAYGFTTEDNLATDCTALVEEVKQNLFA
jgi:hypothetical protein